MIGFWPRSGQRKGAAPALTPDIHCY